MELPQPPLPPKPNDNNNNNKPPKTLILEGVALFFPCGHGYIKAVDPNPAPGTAPIETALTCPQCSGDSNGGECLRCGGVFSGRWCDFCTLCNGFWNFAAWVDYAVVSGAGRIRCRQGVILVPTVVPAAAGVHEAAAVNKLPWPDLLTLGEGDVVLIRGPVMEDGGFTVDAAATLRVKDQVDRRGRGDSSLVGADMTWNLYSTECNVELGSDEGWLPPEPMLNFSRFQYEED